jgi:hypothetical protein
VISDGIWGAGRFYKRELLDVGVKAEKILATCGEAGSSNLRTVAD